MRRASLNKKKLLNLNCLLVGQRSSVVAHWLLVPGDPGLNAREGEKISSFIFEL